MQHATQYTIRVLFTAAVLLVYGFRLPTFPLDVHGHIKNNNLNRQVKIKGLVVFVQADRKNVARTLTDSKGNFFLMFTPEQEKVFNFYCTAPHADTVLMASYNSFDTDVMERTFPVPAKVKKDVSGRPLCPQCKKADRVYAIVYTNPSGAASHNKGAHLYTHIYHGLYYKCTRSIGLGKYYCDRDKVDF